GNGAVITSSSAATLSSVITVVPVADTPNIVVPADGLNMAEGQSIVIDGLSIASPDPSETASGTLTINQASGFVLQKSVNGVWVDQSPAAIATGSVTFRIDAATLSAQGYRINANSYFDGDIRVDVAATAVENAANWVGSDGLVVGVPGSSATGNFNLRVAPVANTPAVFLDKAAVLGKENTAFVLKVNAASPDPDEKVSLLLRIVDAQGNDAGGFVADPGSAVTAVSLSNGRSGWSYQGTSAAIKDQSFSFTPPPNYSSDGMKVIVYANTIDPFGGTNGQSLDAALAGTGTALDLTRMPAASATLSVTGVASGFADATIPPLQTALSSTEDTPVALNEAQITTCLNALSSAALDRDGSEFLGLDLQLLPDWSLQIASGASYSVAQAGTTWRLSAKNPGAIDFAASVAAVKDALLATRVFAPANFSGQGQITVKPFTAEDASPDLRAYGKDSTFALNFTAVADAPSAVVLAATQVTGQEDGGWVSLSPAFNAGSTANLLKDTDGSELLKVRVTAGSGLLLSTDGGVTTLSTNTALVDALNLSNLRVKGAAVNAKGDYSVTVNAVAVESGNGSSADSAASTLKVTLTPVIDGVSAITTQNVNGLLEDQFAVSTAGAPTLASLVKVAATDSDPGEQILYQVFVPTGMTLTALNGAALGSATATTGGLTYTVAAKTAGGADNLGNYALISDANRSGTFTVKLTPLAQEVDGTQKAGTQASADLVVRPVIDGADGLRMQNVEISEDQYSLSAAGAPTLASLVKVAASDSDPGEQIFYRVFVSTGVTLIALNGIDLGSAVAADGGKAYFVAAKTADGGDNLGNYALLPDANQWGSYTVSMTPLAREVDGSERASSRISAQLVVDPVADTATLTNNTQLLQLGITKPLVDDGSTSGPAGSNVLHLPISISGVSDLDTKEAVTLVLTGDIFSQPGVTLQLRLTDGSTRAYTPDDGTIRIEEFDVAGNLPALSGEVLIPKGQAYGAHTLSAAVETQDGSAISLPQLAVNCDFAVISATPPVPSVGVAIDATTDVSGDIKLGDILRVPNAVANQRLELTFPVDASAAFYLLTAAGDIVEPSLGSNVYSLPVMEIGNYRIHWVATDIDHSIVFRARVAVPDFGGDSYSRFVDYALTAGPDADGSYASDNWLITAGDATLDAGDGNDDAVAA
ncbi:MAG: hypothetical protein EBT83_04860, partial [Betaproteobacteria bacterium]|nr:hypothetical protein [Betaproteobacteria bacterium]